MTTSPEIRDLAQRLIAYEAVAGKPSERMDPASLRVYEKLRQGICAVAGIAGFQLLASRALALARAEAPGLGAVYVDANGALHGLGPERVQRMAEFEQPVGASEPRPIDEGIVLIVRLLGLLHIFLGEALTLNLLRFTWPGEVLDGYQSENGSTA